MKRFVPGLMLMMAILGSTASSFAASGAATISGTVRDVNGAPQMGALIELLSSDASTVATAFSDERGRYILNEVVPGHYQLRATAAFFLPTSRNNLRLQAGAQAIVNLTLSTMFEAENWLPAQRRRADEPVDDWKWTLRSTANRPLLRLTDDDGVPISSSAEQAHRLVSEGRITVTNGDGSFGDGGMHQTVVLSRSLEDGDGAVFRADVGDTESDGMAPSAEVSAGYERRSPLGGSTRLLTSFQSDPELTDGSVAGFQVLQMASTQQIDLGDAVLIDVGTLLAAERLEATRIESEPYFRVTARPGSETVVEYRYAAGREVQSADDLDRLKPMLTALTDAQGRPLSDRGSHNEISVSRKLGQSVITLAGFADSFSHGAIAGGGEIDRAALLQIQSGLQPMGVIADPTTGTFELATASYSGHGMSAAWMQPLTPVLSAWVEFDTGTALRDVGVASVNNLAASLAAQRTEAASATIRGKILRTGTVLKAEYRWQPLRTLTQVNAYNVSPEEAYLSFYLRQRLWCGRMLPQGMDAVVEATNLLEQGYQPVLGPDGTTLFLAQVPRAIQGGLAFNF